MASPVCLLKLLGCTSRHDTRIFMAGLFNTWLVSY